MKDTNNKQRKIISVFYEEYRKKILTEFDFEAVVNGAMVETIDGRQVKINKIDKEKRRIYGFIYNKDISKWGHELWWDENGYILGWENIETYTGRESLAILNYGSLVKNKVKKGDCKKIIKPFNIDAALNGALVKTKDGHEVEIDLIINHPSYKEYCIFGNVFFNGRRTSGEYYGWHANGRWDEDKNSNVDLVIVEYVEDNSKTDNSEIKNIEIKYNGTKINIQIVENNGHVQGKIIKPFNLDAVRRGAQIETKDGKRVIVKRIADKPSHDGEIICCDVQDDTGGYLSWWKSDGRHLNSKESDFDLVIVEYAQICEDKPTVKSIDIDGLRINLS